MPFSTKISLLFIAVVAVVEFSQAVPEIWQLTRAYHRQKNGEPHREHRKEKDQTENDGGKLLSSDFAEMANWRQRKLQRLSRLQVPTDWMWSASRSRQQQNKHRQWVENDIENGRRPGMSDRWTEQLKQQQQPGKESFQMCIFLRVGCAKINRSNYSQRLSDYVNGLMVQENVQNGLIIYRTPSEQ